MTPGFGWVRGDIAAAGRAGPAPAADGMERAPVHAGRAIGIARRDRRPASTRISSTATGSVRRGSWTTSWRCAQLRKTRSGDHRARQPGWHAIPCRKEPGGRSAHPRRTSCVGHRERRAGPVGGPGGRVGGGRPARAVRGCRHRPSSKAAVSAGSNRQAATRCSATFAACCWCPSASCSSPGSTRWSSAAPSSSGRPATTRRRRSPPRLMHSFVAPYAQGPRFGSPADPACRGRPPAHLATRCSTSTFVKPRNRPSRCTNPSGSRAGASTPPTRASRGAPSAACTTTSCCSASQKRELSRRAWPGMPLRPRSEPHVPDRLSFASIC